MMKKQIFGVILLLVFIILTNYLWLTMDTQPLWWDQADYMRTCLQYTNRIASFDFKGFFSDLVSYNPSRPPFLMLTTMPFYILGSYQEDFAIMVNILFLALCFFIIFGISRIYFQRKISLLSCCILFCYPLVFGLCRQYLVDISLMFSVLLSIYLLLKCARFSNFKYSLLLGLSLGIGMLTKITYAVFIIGPLFFTIWQAEKEKSKISKSKLNLLVCLVVALILTSFWYLPNLKVMVSLITDCGFGKEALRSSAGAIWSLSAFSFYPEFMANYGISVFFTAVFLLSGFIIFRKGNLSKIMLFLLWIIVPVVFFTFCLSKDIRFLVPVLPATALLTAQGIYEIRSRQFRRLLIILIIAIGLFQFFVDSFEVAFFSKTPPRRLSWKNIVFFEVIDAGCYLQHPKKEDWKIKEFFQALKNDCQSNSLCEGNVITLSNHKAYNVNTLDYYSQKNKIGLSFIGDNSAWELIKNNNFRYIIFKDKFATDIVDCQKTIDSVYVYIKNNPQSFKMIYKAQVFDGSDIYIYRYLRK
ncbi:MAG: glycosyltransferase family 39 protein [Candidatus Omnitrophica bacterium]|nr:glycosyltransferase family 39 protein [Candidatus Omnitrophota bacterium]